MTSPAARKRYRAKNTAYYRAYMQRYRELKRGGMEPIMDSCPGCGGRKVALNDVCRKCRDRSKREVRHRASTNGLVVGCVSCAGPMAEFKWHGKRMYRCSSCGLELKSPTVFLKEAA